jgi:signal transduction histidine kinase
MQSIDPYTSGKPWHGGWLAPLNLAAYVTWLVVIVQAPDWSRVVSGSPRELAGVLALATMMAAYLAINMPATPRVGLVRAAVPLQGLAVLLASLFLRVGGPAVLMIIVAAQAVAIFPVRVALAGIVLANLGLFAIWVQGISVASALLSLLSLLAFQTFAMLTVHYAVSADRARERLAETHAELLATQHLLEQSARSAERLRLSRELRDVAGHKLTAMKLNLRLLERDQACAAREELATASQLADELLADIRAVVGELRQQEGIDLGNALAALTRPFPGVQFDVRIEDGLALDSVAMAEMVLRCAQEGITNAVRHGQARRIAIDIRRDAGRLAVQVRNDGRSPGPLREGNGLTGMRERLVGLGGSLSLVALPAGGAELHAEWPLDD